LESFLFKVMSLDHNINFEEKRLFSLKIVIITSTAGSEGAGDCGDRRRVARACLRGRGVAQVGGLVVRAPPGPLEAGPHASLPGTQGSLFKAT
jgi:hypothetical protein